MESNQAIWPPLIAIASERGNKPEGVPNQDYGACRLGHGVLVAAVADGVGSLKDSATFACRAVIATLESLDDFEPRSSGESSFSLFGNNGNPELRSGDQGSMSPATHDVIKKRVQATLKSLDGRNGATTLLYFVVCQGSLDWGMVGDGAIVLFHGSESNPEIIEMPEKEFTYVDVVNPESIHSNWRIGTLPTSDLTHLFLMTDGVFDALDDPVAFFSYLRDELNGANPTDAESRLQTIISRFPEVHGDDKTLLLVDLTAPGDPEFNFIYPRPVEGNHGI
jgi:serine/threonine protein phosphatase PrpC